MNGRHPSDDRGPWFVFRGHEIYTPALLLGAGVVSMLFTTLAISFNKAGIRDVVSFSSEAILQRFELWRLFTYVLWNPPTEPIWFAIGMLMMWWFGRELEGFFGRRVFLKLCFGLVLAPAVCGVLVGLLVPVYWVGMPRNFSLFVAYATLAPGVSFFFGVSALWTAVIFLGLQVLSCLTSHDWSEMVLSLGGAGFAYSYVRFQQGRWEFPQMPSVLVPNRKPQFRVLDPVPKPEVERPRGVRITELEGLEDVEDDEALEVADSLLEKIARSGLGSLTGDEKKQLEQAREALLRREKSNH